ncbi:Suppressor of PMA 1-7 protein [Nakaseomyces glabratus]|nr:Suppressor of PMA 1-7 protein [Nakaseomyces glabratus]KAH7584353.1 Suppressor of PMA 1-7 protein [Nakaseomyces glabratus]
MWKSVIYLFVLLLGVIRAEDVKDLRNNEVSIKGRLELSEIDISAYMIPRCSFRLYQIGNYSADKPFHQITRIKDKNGTFEFNHVPINHGVNESTYFVMTPSSRDFNLLPQRVLVEVTNILNETTGKVEQQLKAFRNYFGREYFPSKDIHFPDKLEEMDALPYISIKMSKMLPFRDYLQQRNVGLLQSGPLAGILNSKWKIAAVITLLALMTFPYLVEKLDPETARAMKEEARKKQREKYVVKEE